MHADASSPGPFPAASPAGRERLRGLPASPRGRRTFERILSATAELAAEQGFDGVNTNLIASRAGVNIASLYKYFPNKQAIFATISERLTAAFQEEVSGLIAQIDDGRPWREAVAEGMRLAAGRRLNSPGDRAIRMAIRLSPELQGLDASETRAMTGMLAGLIARRSGAAPDQAALVARVAIELAAAILDLLLNEPPAGVDALAAEATDAFIRYLTPWMEGPVTAPPFSPRSGAR